MTQSLNKYCQGRDTKRENYSGLYLYIYTFINSMRTVAKEFIQNFYFHI